MHAHQEHKTLGQGNFALTTSRMFIIYLSHQDVCHSLKFMRTDGNVVEQDDLLHSKLGAVSGFV